VCHYIPIWLPYTITIIICIMISTYIHDIFPTSIPAAGQNLKAARCNLLIYVFKYSNDTGRRRSRPSQGVSRLLLLLLLLYTRRFTSFIRGCIVKVSPSPSSNPSSSTPQLYTITYRYNGKPVSRRGADVTNGVVRTATGWRKIASPSGRRVQGGVHRSRKGIPHTYSGISLRKSSTRE